MIIDSIVVFAVVAIIISSTEYSSSNLISLLFLPLFLLPPSLVQMLNDLDNKTEKTQTKMDKVNDRMKDALEKINDKSTNFCIYIICVVMLLGLATVVYKMVETSKK